MENAPLRPPGVVALCAQCVHVSFVITTGDIFT